MGGKAEKRLGIRNDRNCWIDGESCGSRSLRRAERSGRLALWLAVKAWWSISWAPRKISLKSVKAQSKSRADAAHHRGRRIAPPDKIPHIKRGEIASRIVHRALFSRDGDEMVFRDRSPSFVIRVRTNSSLVSVSRVVPDLETTTTSVFFKSRPAKTPFASSGSTLEIKWTRWPGW